ncbi:MAG: exodeoxyribonuclease III [Rhodocyclaceae bacterium]|nr:exodeoxyribonuclease III [Rhodocyclaceae bacterium]MBK9624744.1 exodeoxyribonuclease III [Rhodocyclaceae bacterium]MBL0077166.1 exodeoxyribonuclease III [Rhodocyclaceae bacterium]MBP6110234.1 exodeoxyribonuclease III [Rhodocyclaceae bacterium]MBP6279357.1 exodeoxyribonuclease III [Rhodocyclaceae bacterium]
MQRPNSTTLRVVSLNFNGIRSAAKKGAFEFLEAHQADIVCVQELKAQHEDIHGVDGANFAAPTHPWSAFHCAEKKGYSGVGIYARQTPDKTIHGFGDAEFDAEGRYIQADFGKLSIISLYLPSGSSSDERQQAKFRFLERFLPTVKKLVKAAKKDGREVLICGDWNIAHTEQDLKNWKSNQKNSGFLPEERAWLSGLFDNLGLIDIHRKLAPEATGEAYTWWSNRGQAWANNVGWRIDYQIGTPGIAVAARRVEVYKAQRFSDHAPLVIDYEWSL